MTDLYRRHEMSRWTAVLLFAFAAAAIAAPIEPVLFERMGEAKADERLGVMIILAEQLDAENIIVNVKNKQERRQVTLSSLKALAERTQAGLLEELRGAEKLGRVGGIIPFWLVNAVYCEATPEVIRSVADRAEVRFVQWDLVTTENALAVMPDVVDVDPSFTVEWNVKKVKADSVWLVHGYTGDGVVVGNIDTGCDYTHPDLAGHMWTDPNYPNHGWNFENNNNNPMDAQGHGTHTCGTVAGDGTGGDTTGMAPKSRIMTTRTKTSISQPYPDTIAENTVINSMQFCVAPPLSPDNHAHLLTMSLGWIIRSWSPRQAVWRAAVTNVAAAGLPYFIAAGNEGSSSPPWNLRCPGHAPSPWHHPAAQSGGRSGSISIGATDASDNIASFSSWGPVTWDTIAPYNDYAYPPGLLKPDFSAPGVNITSTRLGGGYTQMSGTSMATPCAAGVAALMLEKNPNLLPEEVDSIMQLAVVPLGSQPKNNTFGTGRIDAMMAIAMTPFPFGIRYARSQVVDSVGGNGDGIINPGEDINLRVWVTNQCDYSVSGARGLLRTDDPLVTITDSLKHFGTLGVGDTGFTGLAGFGFGVDEACTNGYALKFTLFLSDTLDSVWTSGLTLVCGTPVLGGDSVYAYDGGNGKLDPGEEADIAVQLVNRGKGHGYDVVVVLVAGDSRLTILDSTALYGFVPADSWVMNAEDRFRARVDASVPREFVLPCTLRISQAGYPTRNVPFGIEVGRLTAVDPQPDGPRTPALYYAYENSDSLYSEAPVFEWIDIAGVGTRLNITSDDQTVQFSLPGEFGPFYFYGRRFTQLSVCGNGWVGPGYTTRTAYSNISIPATNTATMLALVWDDLYPPTSGGVWWHHDVANHRLIVQYDSMPYYSNRNVYDWFQVVIHDTTLAAPDGNSVFTYQYLTAGGYNSSTVGINDSTTAIGIQVVFDDVYHRAASVLVPGRAIRFTTVEPTTGIAEQRPLGADGRLALAPSVNPFRRSVTLRYSLPQPATVRLAVYDAAGRVVRGLADSGSEKVAPGVYSVGWDGRDGHGRQAAAGIYFYRLETSLGEVSSKAVLTR
jgi:hypothetical protein